MNSSNKRIMIMITSEMKINAMNKLLEDIRKTREEISSIWSDHFFLNSIDYKKYENKYKTLVKTGVRLMKKAQDLFSMLNSEEKEFVKNTTDYSEIMERGE